MREALARGGGRQAGGVEGCGGVRGRSGRCGEGDREPAQGVCPGGVGRLGHGMPAPVPGSTVGMGLKGLPGAEFDSEGSDSNSGGSTCDVVGSTFDFGVSECHVDQSTSSLEGSTFDSEGSTSHVDRSTKHSAPSTSNSDRAECLKGGPGLGSAASVSRGAAAAGPCGRVGVRPGARTLNAWRGGRPTGRRRRRARGIDAQGSDAGRHGGLFGHAAGRRACRGRTPSSPCPAPARLAPLRQGLQVGDDLRPRQRGAQGGFHVVQAGVPAAHAPVAGDADRHLDEGAGAGAAGAQGGEGDAALAEGREGGFGAVEGVAVEAAVHQAVDGFPQQAHGFDNDLGAHGEGDEGVEAQPAGGGDEADAEDDADGGPHIGHQVAGIGLQGDGIELAAGPREGAGDAEVDGGGDAGPDEAPAGRFEGLGLEQAFRRGGDDGQRGAEDEDAFEAAGEIFGLAVAKGVAPVRRQAGDQDHPQGEAGAGQVDEGFQRIREEADGSGEPPGEGLERNGEERRGDGQPGVVMGLAVRHGCRPSPVPRR